MTLYWASLLTKISCMKPADLKLSPIREDVNEEMEIKNELTMSGNVKAGLFGEILTKVINTACKTGTWGKGLNRVLISKLYKELTRLNIKKPNNPSKKWRTDLNREFARELSQMVKKHKTYWTSLYIGKRNETNLYLSYIPSYTFYNG